MKGILIIGILVMSMFSVIAITDLGNGEYLINGEELMSATDTQIANFMAGSLEISTWNINKDGVKILYNVVHIEPTGNDDEYGVFKYEFETSFSLNDFIVCRSEYSLAQCVTVLITGTEDVVIGDTTITPTYKQAYSEGVVQYNDAIELRDNLIELNELMGLI